MIRLLKNGFVYSPDYIGQKDILIAGGQIAKIADEISIESEAVEVTNLDGNLVIPGLIDGHVHIIGGGGEGGFHTRTPELTLSQCIKGGITTVIGVLGTDGVARTMENLVAKAKGLREEGITAYCMTGNYHVPVKPLTKSIKADIMFIEEVIGVGEIAINDHRSSEPTVQELKWLASEARVAGMLSGKSGAVIVHVGDGKRKLALLEEVAETSDIPITQFIPTHLNRSESIFEAAINYAKKGGIVDFTTSTIKDEDLSSSKCLAKMLKEQVSIEQIMFSSDGQGSLPKFDEDGNYIGLGVGEVTSLFSEVKNAVLEENIPLEAVLKVVTSNVAKHFKLDKKGKIVEGKDADLVILEKNTLSIESVIANGKWMMKEDIIIVKGTFE